MITKTEKPAQFTCVKVHNKHLLNFGNLPLVFMPNLAYTVYLVNIL